MLETAIGSCYVKAYDSDNIPSPLEGQQDGIEVTAAGAAKLTFTGMSSEVDAAEPQIVAVKARHQYDNIDFSFKP